MTKKDNKIILRKDNEIISLTGEEGIEMSNDLSYILISLNNIAHYYYDETPISDARRLEYEREIALFIENNHIIDKLAKLRSIISYKFDHTLGEDDMDDLERAAENIQYWEKPSD